MKNIFLVSVLCFANVFCFASNSIGHQNLPDSLNAIVKEMAHSGVYERGLVGIAGSPSQQNIRLHKIKQMASASDLLELTEYPSPVVRLYSFIALLDRHENIPSATLKSLLDDRAIIVSLTGCIATEKSVGSIIKEIMAQRPVNKI